MNIPGQKSSCHNALSRASDATFFRRSMSPRMETEFLGLARGLAADFSCPPFGAVAGSCCSSAGARRRIASSREPLLPFLFLGAFR